jgi:recombination protein RecA
MFGNPETTTGGNALKFYSSIRLDVRRVSTLKKGDDSYGNQVRVKVVKNKIAPPFKVVDFEIHYGTGISRASEIIQLGTDFGFIKKSGSWYSYGDEKIGQGQDAVKKFLEANPDISSDLEVKIRTRGLENTAWPSPQENSEEIDEE